MMTATLSAEDQRFLDQPRIGVLISNRRDGSPIGVPVWFEWDGARVRMFSAADAPKTSRLRRQRLASLLVTNRVGEAEHWIAFDGPVTVHGSGGFALAEKLAGVYWNPEDPAAAATLATWRTHPEAFCLLTLEPQRIRTGS